MGGVSPPGILRLPGFLQAEEELIRIQFRTSIIIKMKPDEESYEAG